MKNKASAQHAGDHYDARKEVGRAMWLWKHLYRSDMLWYSMGVIIRVVWTVVYPQQGYIHPDEFFQGPEIVFDDIFHSNLTRTHEFHSTAPLRSVAILYLLYGLPVSMLSWINSWSTVPFHLKLICPRATILLLSFLTDACFYRLINSFYPQLTSTQRGTLMNYYGIAHVTLVFFTRTLSNSFEAFLFLALIYLIDLNVSAILKRVEHTSGGPSQSSTPMGIDRDLSITSLAIGCVCALGIFNRPTFPAFAVVPLLYWFISVMSSIGHSLRFQLLLSRILSLIVGAFVLTCTSIICFDSYYYNNGLSFVIDLKNRLIICPVNFLVYNSNPSNLDQHGLHPPWLHMVVNANILFGPLHICAVLWGLSRVLRSQGSIPSIVQRLSNFYRTGSSSTEPSMSPLLPYLYFVPFVPLSIFPHQEPRFLLPLIFPLVLLIVPWFITHDVHRYMFRLWLPFNMFIAIVYGHLHQGGLLPALRYVHDAAAIDTNHVVLITYHTYMPPGYLFTPMSTRHDGTRPSAKLIDLKGADRAEFELTVERVFLEHATATMQLFILLPGARRIDLVRLEEQKYDFHLVEQFGPHLDLDHGLDTSVHVRYAGSKSQWLRHVWQRHRLDLYRVTRG